MRDILICTVGTSLFAGNIPRLADAHPLRQAWAARNWQALALALLDLNPAERACGAEINSITSMLNKGHLGGRAQLFFLVSDTEDGRATGEVLRLYYSNRKNPNFFEGAETLVIEGLMDDDVKVFKNKGLRNLVRRVSEIVRRLGARRVAINATGGYKAQISFAGMIGQALEIPVYYLFERFAEVIELPPQPIALDLSFWLEHYDVFRKLDQVQPKPVMAQKLKDERFGSLIEEEEIEGVLYVSLSATGQLFHESFRYRFDLQRARLLPPNAQKQTGLVVKDNPHLSHLNATGLQTFLDQVLRERPYVRGFHSVYTNPDLPCETGFKLSYQQERPFIELIYSDGSGTARLEVETEKCDPARLNAAVADLNERFA